LAAERRSPVRDLGHAVTAFIARELLRLDAFERDVLEAASVAGTPFRVAALADALGLDRTGVEELCDRWSRSGRFLRLAPSAEVDARAPALDYEFIHCLHPQVIEELIPPTRRSQLQTRLLAPTGATPKPAASEPAVDDGERPDWAIEP
jgi:predicted ATPase